MDMAHLRPEARDLALLPANERLARLPANRWIGYTRASEAITLLGRLLDFEPGRVRPRNLLSSGRPTTARPRSPRASCAITHSARRQTASTRSFLC